MSREIHVTLCVGTACHIMGSADMILLDELVPEHLRSRVEISGVTCMGLCKDEANGKPPFVDVNGEILSGATMDKVLQAIEERAAVLPDGGDVDVGS